VQPQVTQQLDNSDRDVRVAFMRIDAEASKGTAEVSSNIGGVTQAATDTGRVANEVLGASGDLLKQSVCLKDEVGRFLSTIRAA
jgi:hypothetical protein